MKNLLKRAATVLLIVFAFTLLGANLSAQSTFVYTNNDRTANTVSAFSIAGNGALTEILDSPFPTAGVGAEDIGSFGPNRIAVSPVGNFLFAANSISNDVSVFSINPATGGLTLVPGSPFPTGEG